MQCLCAVRAFLFLFLLQKIQYQPLHTAGLHTLNLSVIREGLAPGERFSTAKEGLELLLGRSDRCFGTEIEATFC